MLYHFIGMGEMTLNIMKKMTLNIMETIENQFILKFCLDPAVIVLVHDILIISLYSFYIVFIHNKITILKPGVC